MKKALLPIIALLLLITPFANAFADGMDADGLNNFLAEALDAARIPGASVAVVSPDEVIFSQAYGNAHSNDNPFLIGSMTKSFTALCIMQLVEQSRVNLDDPLSSYPHPGIPPQFISDRVTIRHLLNQNGGIRDYHAPRIKRIYTPGEFYYANANYALLGMVVEVASGQSYGDYVQQHIFDPIGMQNSYVSRQQALDGGQVQGFRNYFGLQLPVDIDWPDYQLAAGYLSISANDMAKYLQMYLNGGTFNGNYIISSESIEQMWQQSTLGAELGLPDEMADYGMGWFIAEKDGSEVIYHGGSVETYSSYMMIVPDKQLAYVILFNSDDFFIGENFRENIIGGVYSYTVGNNDATPIPSGEYWRGHLLIDAILLIYLLLCSLPLILIRRFKRLVGEGRLNIVRKLVTALLHLLLPILGVLALRLLPYPLDVLFGFVPDIIVVYFAGLAVLVLTGVYKAVIAISVKRGKAPL